ncbi:hypothetical protein L3Q82_003281 [Scortum barcoo]|uniref:Uncharacterized protein n=1 Tax=Scortum barcoo TaxID=214431 RepID=A0ACB8VUR7_9TELE|nr:hypothetical protein L3Q82_003281 [Scortum barcoo]
MHALEFTPMNERVTSLRLRVGDRSLAVVCAYGPNSSTEYLAFLESLGGVLDMVLRLGTPLPFYWGTSTLTWAATVTVIPGGACSRRNGLPDLNPGGVLLLDFCASHSLSITNTMFKHKGVHQCTWHQDTRSRKVWRWMIDFVVVSSDLRLYVLDTWVKRGAELSSRSPPGGELDLLAEEEVGQTWQTQMYCEGLLGTSGRALCQGGLQLPPSGRASHRFPREAGDIESEGTMFSASIVNA